MIILWHHQDLRTTDHPLLTYIYKQNNPFFPIYIDDDTIDWKLGNASKWWLKKSLESLKKDYQKLHSNLYIAKGPALNFFIKLHKTHKITEICWLEKIEPSAKERDEKMIPSLEKMGIKITIFPTDTLTNLREIKTKANKAFKVFTPFFNTICKEIDTFSILPTPKLPLLAKIPTSLHSSIHSSIECKSKEHLIKYWSPGRKGAIDKLKYFCRNNLKDYSTNRDFPALEGTSMLSPHLHFGEISIREVWNAIAKYKNNTAFLRELGWREFSNYFLFHFSEACNVSWKKEFEKFAWEPKGKTLKCWQEGKTGYPIVDAGMRQLLETGWMHNRVRMIVASFLTKDLMIHWKEGAKWFWENLVDADLSANTMGWQWVAGCGVDAAPYFRIFNPSLQAKKFDPEAVYIKKYVPELAKLSSAEIHEMPMLEKNLFSNINKSYIDPIVNHESAKKSALEKYKKISS